MGRGAAPCSPIPENLTTQPWRQGHALDSRPGPTLVLPTLVQQLQELPWIQYITANSPLTPKLPGAIVPCSGNAQTDDPACAAPYTPLAACQGAVDPQPKRRNLRTGGLRQKAVAM